MLQNNQLAFIALANEYCSALESAGETMPGEFVASMLRLLPRIYISATDLRRSPEVVSRFEEQPYLASSLDEDYYDSIRRSLESLLGEHDTYLEVFEEDMKYSDTPIAANISEGLSDLFQVLFNFLEMVRDASEDVTLDAIAAVASDFESYWAQILCNVMRPLNQIYCRQFLSTEEDNY